MVNPKCIEKEAPTVKEKAELEQENGRGRQIGIMGGTFNPVHIAHLVAAEQAMTKLRLDEVWFIPDNIPPNKNAPLTSAKDRATMLDLATKDNPKFRVKLLELFRGGVSYTVDTMRYLKEKAPQNNYYLIMGSDQVNSFHTWKEASTLAKLVTLVGIRRPGYPQDPQYPQYPQYPMIWVDAPDIQLSSTAIRRSVATGTSIRYLVPEAVRKYIVEKGLYLDETNF
ncbi:nicotinate-nucleotide adenylyltransferase [Lactobacillus helveticus]|uniref:Probable nicotinate-nucleotide adenylyltransferase n=1 Tax=Lactobacillus helveticus TaxID=1587 RepID=A0AAU8XT17_LACHE|nr:nicotinate-nucleotide adenylyltransferase [Lactobacillus helveticus]ANZ55752.1 nicotinate (nicotinamide) nucleotide adenylyltransferase [Lactobacillus helveticus]AQY53865.1 nicotinate-nucleotide adenylyltransferase [Lactobacillus helveticus]AUI73954.1 nicotinate (nicotinamide) nucleotide adenylyltransferase [Lactobacillus helveticus]MBU6034293.1 nicotinate-nucleotide adenylyltransferase [Lactobacillus helveticus]MBW1219611.1 nicotinate-nucleotide adenylyltransferase [Lactobacillus helveticu